MNTPSFFGVCWLLSVLLSALSVKASDANDARFLLIYGRPASATEHSSPNEVQALRATLLASERDASFARAQAWRDAFGSEPANTSVKQETGASYIEHLQQNIERLTAEPELRTKMIQRAYRYLFQRDPYAEEIQYWLQRPTAPFVTLVGCLEHWGRRNQPGLMVTSGTPTIVHYSRFLNAVLLSRSSATELRSALKLIGSEESELASARGHNLVGVAPEVAVTGGHAFFAAAGKWDNPLVREE